MLLVAWAEGPTLGQLRYVPAEDLSGQGERATGPATVRRVHATLSSPLNTAVKRRLLAHNLSGFLGTALVSWLSRDLRDPLRAARAMTGRRRPRPSTVAAPQCQLVEPQALSGKRGRQLMCWGNSGASRLRRRPRKLAGTIMVWCPRDVDRTCQSEPRSSMGGETVFTVSGSTATVAQPIGLAEAGLTERAHLQEWVLAIRGCWVRT